MLRGMRFAPAGEEPKVQRRGGHRKKATEAAPPPEAGSASQHHHRVEHPRAFFLAGAVLPTPGRQALARKPLSGDTRKPRLFWKSPDDSSSGCRDAQALSEWPARGLSERQTQGAPGGHDMPLKTGVCGTPKTPRLYQFCAPDGSRPPELPALTLRLLRGHRAGVLAVALCPTGDRSPPGALTAPLDSGTP